MTEPDVLLRGKFSVPKNGKLLGTRLNDATIPPAVRLDQWIEFNKRDTFWLFYENWLGSIAYTYSPEVR